MKTTKSDDLDGNHNFRMCLLGVPLFVDEDLDVNHEYATDENKRAKSEPFAPRHRLVVDGKKFGVFVGHWTFYGFEREILSATFGPAMRYFVSEIIPDVIKANVGIVSTGLREVNK